MKAIYAVPATLAVAYRAYSHKSLTPAGIVVAVLTAIAHAVHPWNLPFVLLVVFFLAGTRVTKVCPPRSSRRIWSNHLHRLRKKRKRSSPSKPPAALEGKDRGHMCKVCWKLRAISYIIITNYLCSFCQLASGHRPRSPSCLYFIPRTTGMLRMGTHAPGCPPHWHNCELCLCRSRYILFRARNPVHP